MSEAPAPDSPRVAAERILVLRLGALGDVLRTLPAVSALRRGYPGAHIAWLVEPAAAGALEGQPWLDEILVFPRDALAESLRRVRLRDAFERGSRLVRELRARRFDLVLDFHAILKSGLLARLTAAPVRVGYAPPHAREASHHFATRRVRLSERPVSRFERNEALVRSLGVEDPVDAKPFRVDPEARARVGEALGGGDRFVALHPGTSAGTPHKRWSPDAWAALARRLGERHDVQPLVTWGPVDGERERAEAVVAAAAGAAALGPRTARLQELAALFEGCRLFVGSDSGPLHLASLVGTPVVQVLGPTHPVENAPWAGVASRSVRVPLACSPCRRGCAAAHCMRAVSPETVLAAAESLVAAAVPGPEVAPSRATPGRPTVARLEIP